MVLNTFKLKNYINKISNVYQKLTFFEVEI